MKKYLLLSVFFVLSCFVFVVPAKADEPLVDTTAPVIALVGSSPVNLTLGDVYTDAGATATDETDGDISANIVVNNLVDTATAGTYTVRYNVSDTAGNAALEKIRTVVVSEPAQETFIIRNGETLVWQGTVTLPAAGTVSIPDSNNISHTIDARSVLALLYSIDQNSEAFSISNLQYFDSYNSFYIKCITPAGGSELCDNWQFAVGNQTPSLSIDATIVNSSQTIGIYFGISHSISVNAEEVIAGTAFDANALKYNYLNNSWGPLTNVSIGVTVPNPADPWNPTVIATYPVDSNGHVSITIMNAGEYTVGVVEDYYYPSFIVKVLQLSKGKITEETKVDEQEKFDLEKALAFLKENQSSDGSFGSELYTDWVAIAYAAADYKNDSNDLLLQFLKKRSKLSTNLTDNERRAMALLALGQNPYSFENINYIEAIIKQFDGTQFGDAALVNDDIFALFPLLSAGYLLSDEIIAKDITFIIGKQRSDGSWEGSVDLTAAAIQALGSVNSTDLIKASIDKAAQYLKDKQEDTGGFGSIYTSAWTIQAMKSLEFNWTKNNTSTDLYLAKQQTEDGAALINSETKQNRVWATSYAIPAALGKDWMSILKPVAKQIFIEKEIITTLPYVNELKTEAEPAVIDQVLEEEVSIGQRFIADVGAQGIEEDSKIQNDIKEGENLTPTPSEFTEETTNKQMPATAGLVVLLLIGVTLWFRFV